MFFTKIDSFFDIVARDKRIVLGDLAKQLGLPKTTTIKIGRYLEQLGYVLIDYKHVKGPAVTYKKSPEKDFASINEHELINKMKFFKSSNDVKSANRLIYDLYKYAKARGSEEMEVYTKVRKYYLKNFLQHLGKKVKDPIKKIKSYKIDAHPLTVEVDIIKQELEPVPFYILSLLRFTDITKSVIDLIKEEVISTITFNVVFKTHKEEAQVKQEYKKKILDIMGEVFPDLPHDILFICTDYIIMTSLGMGEVEILLKDKFLEEIVINNAFEPIWVYHKEYGWLETNIILDDESIITHYSTLAGRNVDKTITVLNPLMDAHLKTGDRVNATLHPISTKGNTITIRKFAENPWSITDFIQSNTIDYYTAALVWTAIQYELSILIVGGTGSGKTSTLNVFSIFIPPNQRVVSIEDTRELKLPDTLHWVPMQTRLANPEGKGEITMLDLIVNSLRMRPDRIIVGEIRRKKEAEVLFEAMHTGHSVYATLHANTVNEAIIRLTTEPIGIAKSLLSAVDLIFVQNRNRRTNKRRTFQVAEMDNNGDFNLIFNYNFKSDKLEKINAPKIFYQRLMLFSGLEKSDVEKEINDKIKILKYLVSKKIRSNNEIALIVDYYYIDKKYLMKKLFGGQNK